MAESDYIFKPEEKLAIEEIKTVIK